MDVRTTQGMFSWNELLTKDVEGAKSFYTQLFGWEMEESPLPAGEGNPEGLPYTILKAGGEQVAGLWKLPPDAEQMGTPSYWGSYVTVNDVDETAKKAEQLGAKILVPPTAIPDVGRFCTIMDPQGAVISFIKYE